MDKEYLMKYYFYFIIDNGDGYYLKDNRNYILESEQLIDIGKNLIKFANKHKEHIIKYNNYIKDKQFKEWKEIENREKPKPLAKIYIMECAGKYKIGVSKNVEKRCKQLNNRPFKVNIVYQSENMEDAYGIEEALHEIYEDKKIEGEWFNLDKEDVETIIKYLEDDF